VSQGRASIDTSSETDHGPRAGRLLRELIRSGRSFSGRERHCCFLNTRGPRFANISAASGLDFPDDGRAASVVDWDQDGDLDLWFVNRSAPQVRFLRNDTSHGHDYLAVRLEGTTDNRDAIGARVELVLQKSQSDGGEQNSGHAPLATSHSSFIKTVRAGNGYLAQSSKWIHFGLGESAQIDSLTIRWPGGRTERIRGLSANRHYRIVQGRGQAEAWDIDRRNVDVTPSDYQAPQASDLARVVLTVPLSIPTVEFNTWEGGLGTISGPESRAKLVNFWASWCRPCIVELEEFAGRHGELRAADVDVIALNVDNFGESGADEVAVRRIVEQLAFPFVSGRATAALRDQFQLLHDKTIDMHTTLPIPSSFLIDSNGQLAVIYKGPVEVDQLLVDVRQLSLPPEERRRVALPFAGRWSSPVRGHRLLLIALDQLASGRFDETLAYLDDHRAEISRDREFYKLLLNLGQVYSGRNEHEVAKTYYHRALQIKPDLARAHFNLGVTFALERQFDAATEHFLQAVAAEPEDSEARVSLAKTLATQRNFDEAMDQLRAAIEIDSRHVAAHVELGTLLSSQGQLEEGTAVLRRAVELNPNDRVAHLQLSAALGSNGDFDAAIEQFHQLLAIHPNDTQAHARLGQALLVTGDPGQAVHHFERAIRLDPQDRGSMLRLAWLSATCPLDAVRNGERAVELAERLDRATGHKDPLVLDTLAAAYAEHGDFPAAARAAGEALVRLRPDQKAVADAIRARVTLYESERPYRDIGSEDRE